MNGISGLLDKYGTSLEETRKMMPKLTAKIAQQRKLKPPTMPTTPQFFNPEEAKELGVQLEPRWSLKVTPGANGGEPSISYITPTQWEVTQAGQWISPEGKRFTPEQMQAEQDKSLAAQEQMPFMEKGVPTPGMPSPATPVGAEEVFGRLYPTDEFIPDVEAAVKWATEKPEEFVESMFSKGRTADTDAALSMMFPGVTPEQLDEFWAPAAEIGSVEFAGAALGEAWTALTTGDFSWGELGNLALSALGVGGAWLEKYAGRPWEVAILEIKNQSLLMGEEPDQFAVDAKKITDAAFEKYGWSAVFSEDVTTAWHGMKEKYKEAGLKESEYAMTALEWINPAYWIPIGGVFGLGARFTTKIPILGKVMARTAAGVQAAERGLVYPITKPIKLGAKGLESIGVKMGEAYSKKLIAQTEHLLLEIPASDKIVKGVLVDNWMKRTLTLASKMPPIRKGIEKGLGWRILVKRESQAVEDIVGRAAVVHAEISRMGINAKAKVWELRAIEMNPVKLFGFGKNAYSPKMVNRLLPEFKGTAEAGTLEHIFTKPEMYRLSAKQAEYVTRVHEINTEILNLLKKEGVPPSHVTEDWWIHRVVTGKVSPEGELIALRGRPGVGGKAIGAKPSFEMHRKAPTMAEGIAWGVQYGRNPEMAITTYMEEAFKKIADARFLKYIENFGVLPSERLAERFPEVVKKALLTQTELADAAKFSSLINRAIRGEKLPEQTLRAIERRFPEIGRKFRALVKDEPMKPIDEAAYLAEHGAKDSFGFPSPRVGGIGLDDFIQLKGELGKGLKAPRGFIVGEGILGKKIPAWKVKQADGSITLIPKDEAIVLGGKPKIEGIKGFEGDAVTKEFTISPPKLDKKAGLTALRDEVKALTEARKAPYWKARSEKAFKMEQMRRPEIGEGYIMAPFAGGRIFKQEFVDSFNKFFGHEGGLGVLKVTSDIAGILRITKAALDLSAMAIQGLPSFGLAHSYLLFNPSMGVKLMGAWYKAFFNSTRAFFDAGVVAGFMKKNEAATMQRISFGGSSRTVDYFATLETQAGLGGKASWLMEKIPLKPYHRAETAFFAAGEMVRDEFWRILSPKALARGQEFELARILDRITGIVDPKTLGVPLTVRQLEQTFTWFAPSYTRACLTVVADIFRGGMTGAMARKAIGGMVTAGSIYYTAVQYAIATVEGKSDEEAWNTVKEGFSIFEDPITGEVEWKPSGRFMTIQIGNYNMGFGGFWYGLLRLAGNIAATVDEVGDRERIDLIRVLKHGSLNKQDNPFIYWWYSRSSPLFGSGFELATGKEFFGYPIETPAEYASYIARRFEPIWAEQGLNWMIPGVGRDNEIPEGLARVALIPAELFGLRTFPESSWIGFYDKVNDYVSRLPKEEIDDKQLEAWTQGKLEWKHLTQIQKANLLSRYPDLDELYAEAQSDSAVRNSPHWEAWQGRIDEEREIYYSRIEELTGQLSRGEIDTREYREKAGEAGQNYGAILEGIARDPNYAEIYDFFDKKEADGDRYGFRDDVALGELQARVMYAEDLIDSKGDYDWDERDRRVDAFIEKWGQETYDRIQQYFQEKKGLNGLPEPWIRKAADTEKLGRGYWRLPYKPIINMDEDDAAEGNIPVEYSSLWKQYQALETEQAREDFIKRYPDMARDWRAEYRGANPEEDARLALWGYGGKLQTMEAYDMVTQWGKELGIPLEQMGLGLPPRSLIEKYFEHSSIVTDTSGGSIEARLYKLQNPEWLSWGVENWGWGDLTDDNEEMLGLRVKYKEQFEAYDLLAETEERKAYLETDVNFQDAFYRVEAYDQGYAEGNWDRFVEYSKLPTWGDWRERFIMDPANKAFYDEWLSEDVGQGHQRITLSKISPVKRDEIYLEFTEQFEEWNDTAGLTEKAVEKKREALLKGSPGFAEARVRVQAYDDGVPESYIDDVVEYRAIPSEGYANERYMKEHPDFYKEVWLGVWENQKIDMAKLPSVKVEGLWKTYQGLPSGTPRLDFRAKHLDLDDWGVLKFGWKPITGRGSTEAPKTPWEVQQEVERFKELF